MIQEIQAIKNDLDIVWQDETLAEETTGKETEFRLLHVPVKPNSLQVYIDNKPASIQADVDWDAGVITPTQTMPADKHITASYTQLGMQSQVKEIVETIPSISLDDIVNQIQTYQTVIAWLNKNFPA